MSRPSEIYTKTVSVRLPMDSYIELLQNATSNKMSLSEFMTMKLMSNNKEFTAENKKSTEKVENIEKESKWILKDTFRRKELFKHPAFENVSIANKLGKGRDLISKDGKWKLVTVKNAHHRVYQLAKQ